MSSQRIVARAVAAILLATCAAITACGDSRPAAGSGLEASGLDRPGGRVRSLQDPTPPSPPPSVGGAELVAQLGCAGCHPGAGGVNRARAEAPPLTGIGARRPAGYIFAYLADPSRARSGGGRARMPDFHLDERERLALTLYLGTLDDDSIGVTRHTSSGSDGDSRALGEQLDAALARARDVYPAITAEVGERIYASLNCAACHSQPAFAQWLNGPELSAEGSRVKAEWLHRFLAKPHSVRPFGAYPGSGGRMPDFHLSPDEVDSLAAYLGTREAALPASDSQPGLSVFARREVEALLRDRLPCLGCHELDGEGGQIGPDLSSAGSRLRPAYIRAIITNPQHSAPGTIMPRTSIPAREVTRLAMYLAARDSSAAQPADTARAGYLSLVDNVPSTPASGAGAGALYARICANCHGGTGGGDGWNAAYLPVRPTTHSDAEYMSTRTDGTIYAGIAAGGYVLDRNNRMPAFGETLSRAEIASLVKYIRKLCDCEGPAWSRDGMAR